MTYIFTPIEDYVQKLYHHLSIHVPEQIDMIDIAAKLDVWLHFECIGSKAIERNGIYSIFIDNRISNQEQWQDFGHELCHALIHCGNQLQLPKDFISFQESKARNFALHFCIPTFMLEKLELPTMKKEAIEFIAMTFNVTTDFAKKRMERWIQQQESFMLFEKLAESPACYETDHDHDKVRYLDDDLEDDVKFERLINSLDLPEEVKAEIISDYKYRYELIKS
jgi:Zn-dependent peptidase ImmA (M78 family)